MSLPKLLIISPIVLFPLDMGSKVRILNILKATNKKFDITFLSACDRKDIIKNEELLRDYCSHIILLPSLNRKNLFTRFWHKVNSTLFYYALKIPKELYYSGLLNLSQKRLEKLLDNDSFHLVLFEYWYASGSIKLFKRSNIPCILDMHDILWKKFEGTSTGNSKSIWRSYIRCLNRGYKELEEKSWQKFKGLITINKEEDKYIHSVLSEDIMTLKAGTGVDLNLWSYSWEPLHPPRIIFYGSLSGLENKRAALKCIQEIMPKIWIKRPDAEIWFIGANPPKGLIGYAKNERRIKVTGYIEDVKNVLASATLAIYPLEGRYGFRGRIIEVMAVGVPVITSYDAVFGMELENGKGISVCDNNDEMVSIALEWINSPNKIKEQSLSARKQVKEKYSFYNTYGKIVDYLESFIRR